MIRSIYNKSYQNYKLFPIYSHHHVITHFFVTHSWILYMHKDHISVIDHFYCTKENRFEIETKHMIWEEKEHERTENQDT